MNQYMDISAMFKALADEHRLKIVEMLSCGEMCACKILEEFDFSQPALSQHMKVLCGSGLVNGVREGAWMHYTLNEKKFMQLREFIDHILGDMVESSGRSCLSNKKLKGSV